MSYNNLKSKGIIKWFVFTLFTSLAIVSISAYIVVPPNNSKSIQLLPGKVVTQKVYIERSDKLFVNYLNKSGNLNKETKLNVKIKQNDKVKTESFLMNNERTDIWDYLHIDVSSFEVGEILIEFTIENGDIDLLTVPKVGNGKIGVLSLNGEEIPCSLMMYYDYFNLRGFAKVFAICGLLIGGIIIGYKRVYCSLTKYPLAFATIIAIIITALKNDLFHGSLSGWCITPWLYTYDFGFISRGLPGQILLLFNNFILGDDFVTKHELKYIFGVLLIMLCGLIVTVAYKIDCKLNRCRESTTGMLGRVIFIVYICSPFFITFYISNEQLGRLDVILNICFLLSSYLIYKRRFVLFIPILSFVAIASHQIYIFTELPMLLFLMLYQILIRKKEEFKAPLIITFLLCFCGGYYFQFMSSVTTISSIDMIKDMQSRTDVPILDLAVQSEHFMTPQMFTDRYKGEFYQFGWIYRYFMFVVMYMPFYYLFYAIWKNVIENAEGKLNKMVYFLIAVAPLGVMPIWFTVAYDWHRWTVEYGMAAFIALLLMLFNNDFIVMQGVKNTFDKITKYFGKSWYLYLCLYSLMSTQIYSLYNIQKTLLDIGIKLLNLVNY